MRRISISDNTLCSDSLNMSFRDKIETAEDLCEIEVDAIELPAISKAKADSLLVKTVSSGCEMQRISVACGLSEDSIKQALESLSQTKNPSVRLEIPVSPVGLEYTCHVKPDKLPASIRKAASDLAGFTGFKELVLRDATRSTMPLLSELVSIAEENGFSLVTICDDTGSVLPDEFAGMISELKKGSGIELGVMTNDSFGLAIAAAIAAVTAGASVVKTSAFGSVCPLDRFAKALKETENRTGAICGILYTTLAKEISKIKETAVNTTPSGISASAFRESNNQVHLDSAATKEDLLNAALGLGYDLTDSDLERVFAEFSRISAEKTVGTKELDAIIASVSLETPELYKLKNYVVNTGDVFSPSAQITLEKNGEELKGISIGNGPIDAAFLAIESIIGSRYELDDFQIKSVTDGKEALGSAVVRLRHNGRLFSGTGLSSDIIGASIRAYLGAVNKISFFEEIK